MVFLTTLSRTISGPLTMYPVRLRSRLVLAIIELFPANKQIPQIREVLRQLSHCVVYQTVGMTPGAPSSQLYQY